MNLRKLLGLGREPALPPPSRRTPPPAARRTPTPAPSTVPHEEFRLTASELAAAWSPGSERLVLRATTPLARGHRVRLLVTADEAGVIPVTGAVSSVSPSGGRLAVEIQVDADRREALQRLLSWQEGVAPKPVARAPRFRLSLPAFVVWPEGNAYMTTTTVSLGGCGLAWSGPLPSRGSPLQIRLGSGPTSATFRGRTCWVREEARGVRVGVRFVAGQDAALAALIDGQGRPALAS